jgi:hypothetical protein
MPLEKMIPERRVGVLQICGIAVRSLAKTTADK